MLFTRALKRMATSSGPIVEGLFAVNKPTDISSANILRKLQNVFSRSPLFKDWITAELDKRQRESNNQKRKRRTKRGQIRVKLGHGGTLDPMATGVLVVGVGSGTKMLSTMLGGEKEYIATAMLGAATNTYDRLGKSTKRAEWRHVTREMVEEKLKLFRGEIMQIPPIFSALNMNGKRLYEYARSGEELPKEIEARKMKVDRLELLDFETEHRWELPGLDEGAGESIKDLVQKGGKKVGELGGLKGPEVKRVKVDEDSAGKATTSRIKHTPTTVNTSAVAEGKPPVLRFHLTVSSGFYVRSFIHDLGIALGSAAHMVELVRTRQSSFKLGAENTIEWEDFGLKERELLDREKGKEVEKVEKEDVEEDVEEDVKEEEEEGKEKPRPVWEEKFTRAMELFKQSESVQMIAATPKY